MDTMDRIKYLLGDRHPMFKVGDILRYGSGSTALMQVTYISVCHGGSVARYYGTQCMGGKCGNYHEKSQLASEEDLKMWEECSGYRRFTVAITDSEIVGVVED